MKAFTMSFPRLAWWKLLEYMDAFLPTLNEFFHFDLNHHHLSCPQHHHHHYVITAPEQMNFWESSRGDHFQSKILCCKICQINGKVLRARPICLEKNCNMVFHKKGGRAVLKASPRPTSWTCEPGWSCVAAFFLLFPPPQSLWKSARIQLWLFFTFGQTRLFSFDSIHSCLWCFFLK